MKIGTKSVLIGAHQFILHPLLLALGWWKAYGFHRVVIRGERLQCRNVADLVCGDYCPECGPGDMPETSTSLLDPRLWLAFVVHDLGYVGKPNMDGPEGETHPELGARIMRRLCGDAWGDFVLLHSRYYAKRLGRPVSPLCHADKWVIVLEPAWLYLPRVRASGELAEYMALAKRRGETMAAGGTDPLAADEREAFLSGDPKRWNRAVKAYMRRWLAAHAGGQVDTWTRLRHGANT